MNEKELYKRVRNIFCLHNIRVRSYYAMNDLDVEVLIDGDWNDIHSKVYNILESYGFQCIESNLMNDDDGSCYVRYIFRLWLEC